MRMRFVIWALTGLVFLFSVPRPARAAEVTLDRIVAVVNGRIITEYEVQERMKEIRERIGDRQLTPEQQAQLKELRKQIIDQMVTDILLDLETERYGIKVSDADVRDAVKAIMERTGLDDAGLRKELQVQGLTYEKFFENKRAEIRKRRLVSGLVQVVVSEEEVRKAFDAKHGVEAAGDYLHLRLILLPAGMSAADLKRDIEAKKTTFAQAADLYSQGPGAGQGGDLGVISRKDLAQDWNEALQGVPVGGISKPFKVQGQEALLLNDELKELPQGDFALEKDQIYEDLYNKKMEAFLTEYLTKLKAKAVVEYRD